MAGKSFSPSIPGLVYSTLNPAQLEIRVLDLECSTNYNADIHGQLRTISLKQDANCAPEPYEALSYTWGTEISPRKISINGTDLSIGTNLEVFLRQRRQVDKTVTLWIDAICINQADDHEKGSQIPLMGKIYMHASSMTIFLGATYDNSDLAMQELRKLGAGSVYEKMPILERRVLEAFNGLLNRPWWSRVWIIQEVVFGGIGPRVNNIKVGCGQEEIQWTALVIAAGRMLAYRAYRRQYFPSINHIHELDRLRENGFDLGRSMNQTSMMDGSDSLKALWSLELVSHYRRFNATDPKDKVFALAYMFTEKIPKLISPNYTDSLRKAYKDFASWTIREIGDLEVLKHSGPSSMGLPTWVPDWSIKSTCIPLPSTKDSLFKHLPWWSDATDHSRDEAGAGGDQETNYYSPGANQDDTDQQREMQLRLKRLEINAGELVKLDSLDEIPASFPHHGQLNELPKEMKDVMSNLLANGSLMGFIMDTGGAVDLESDDPHINFKNVERQTQRSIQRALKQAMLSSHRRKMAPRTGVPILKPLQVQGDHLSVQGVIWDTIEEIHNGFVSDVEANLDSATEFLVALGQCKAMAEDSQFATRLYPDLEKRLKSFWGTILAGQIPKEALATGVDLFCDYMTWLPPIPASWKPETPELTVTTEGLLWLAEGVMVGNEVLSSFFRAHPNEVTHGGPSGLSFVHSSYKFKGVVPAEWTEADREQYTRDFARLGRLWQEQRFDLYHTPFELLYVVPDPYRHMRMRLDSADPMQNVDGYDKLAQRKALRWARDDELRPGSKVGEKLAHQANQIRRTRVSRVPYSMLENDIERYALGRRFFVTRKGTFGLAPMEAHAGDVIAVVVGSDVPLVLRRKKYNTGNAVANDTKGLWTIVGESYVQDIELGAIIDKISTGKLDPATFIII